MRIYPGRRGAIKTIARLCCATVLYTAGAAVLQAAPGAAVVLPALTQPASGEHHVGKVVWADLVTPDLEAAKRFYGGLFGWTFRDVAGDPNYALALRDGEPLAGLFQKPLTEGQAQQPAWLTGAPLANFMGGGQLECLFRRFSGCLLYTSPSPRD